MLKFIKKIIFRIKYSRRIKIESKIQLKQEDLFPLPLDIIRYIYLFDNTYREYYSKNVIPFIHMYDTYTYKSPYNELLYLIIDKEKMESTITNDLKKPNFISTMYFLSKHKGVKKINLSIMDIEYIKHYIF